MRSLALSQGRLFASQTALAQDDRRTCIGKCFNSHCKITTTAENAGEIRGDRREEATRIRTQPRIRSATQRPTVGAYNMEFVIFGGMQSWIRGMC
jgi:hypothetical protein